MEFLKLLLVVLALLGIVFIGFAIRILIIKNGKFPEIHVGHNKEMRKRNIHCAKTIDKKGFVPSRENCSQNTNDCDHCLEKEIQ
jgi:hypothetical protein